MVRYTFWLLCLLLLLWPKPVQALEFTEIAYNTIGSDAGHEWLELHNETDTSVDLTGWLFADAANHYLAIPPAKGSQGSLILLPGEYLILASSANLFLTDHADFSGSVIDTTLNLPNYSASQNPSPTLQVLSKTKAPVIAVTYVPTKRGDQGYTLEKQTDGTWADSTVVGGSPGQPPLPPIIYSNTIHFSELMPNPAGADADHEWIEFFNSGESIVDLAGWTLKTSSRQVIIPASTHVAPLGFVVYTIPGSILKNSDEIVQLVTPRGSAIDSVAFSGAAPNDQSYSLSTGRWRWTDQLTPGRANQINQPISPSPMAIASHIPDSPSPRFLTPEPIKQPSPHIIPTFSIDRAMVITPLPITIASIDTKSRPSPASTVPSPDFTPRVLADRNRRPPPTTQPLNVVIASLFALIGLGLIGRRPFLALLNRYRQQKRQGLITD